MHENSQLTLSWARNHSIKSYWNTHLASGHLTRNTINGVIYSETLTGSFHPHPYPGPIYVWTLILISYTFLVIIKCVFNTLDTCGRFSPFLNSTYFSPEPLNPSNSQVKRDHVLSTIGGSKRALSQHWNTGSAWGVPWGLIKWWKTVRCILFHISL